MHEWVEIFGTRNKVIAAVSVGVLSREEVLVQPVKQHARKGVRYALLPCGSVVIAYRDGRAPERLRGVPWEQAIKPDTDNPGRVRSFNMTDEDYKILCDLGGGNATEGLRRAIQNFKI